MMLKKFLLGLLVAVVAVAVVVWVRGATWQAEQAEPIAIQHGAVRDGAAARFAEALRFRTVSQYDVAPDPDAFGGFLDWLAETYPLVHAELPHERFGGWSPLFRWEGSDPTLDPVLLMAHYDVVPVEPGTEHEWTYPPFAGTVADGKVWGRGAADNKSGVVAIMEAVESLLAEGFAPARTIYLAFGHDEEIGGENGAARISAHLQERGVRLAWVLDEGGAVLDDNPLLGRPTAMIGTAEKGYLSLRLVARADGGHSSRPAGATAVGILAAAVDRVQRSPFPARLQPPVTDTMDMIAAESRGPLRYALANRWLTGPFIVRAAHRDPGLNAWVRTTTAPTMLAAGDKDNVLPQRAEAVINFRLLSGDTVESVTRRVTEIVDDERITISRYGSFGIEPSPVSSVDDPFYRTLAGLIRGLWPDVVVMPNLVSGATDSRHYLPLTDRVYRFMPVRITNDMLEGVHGTDERVDAASWAEGIQFYRMLIRLEAGVSR